MGMAQVVSIVQSLNFPVSPSLHATAIKYIANAHKLLEYKLDSSVSTALDQAPSGFILHLE